MAVTPELVDAMIATGLTREQIADLIKAELAAEAAKAEAKRAAQRVATAARVRKHREAQRNASNALQPLPSVTERYTEADPNGPAPLPPHTPPITPTPNTHSDPAGSGSPSVEPTAPAAPTDPRQELFGRGKRTVRQLTGRAMDGCGSLIGRWLKVANDDAVIVLAVIDDAVAKELANPIPWIEATIKAEAQRNGSGSHDLFNGRTSGGRPSPTVNSAVATAVARHAARRGLGPGGRADDRRSRDPHDHSPGRHDPEIEDADWSPARGYHAAH